MGPLIFVHIPKTAGTSFRMAAESWFGSHHLLYDYGGGARRTSTIFRQYEAGVVDWAQVIEDVRRAHFVTGHFPAKRYLPSFGPKHFCTFVRDPVERAVSQYFHHKRALGYTQSLEAFIDDPRFHDQQHRMLNGLPLESIGFVGVTESYSDSLSLFNAQFGASLKVEFHNRSGQRGRRERLPSKLVERVRAQNPGDTKLHESAFMILNRRLSVLAEEKDGKTRLSV